MEQRNDQPKKTRSGHVLPPLDVRMRNLKPRPKGIPNKNTTILKEAILLAAAVVGSDKKGKDGLLGYLTRIAVDEPTSFCMLLGKVLPLTIQGDKNNPLLHHVKVTLVRADGSVRPEPLTINARPAASSAQEPSS